MPWKQSMKSEATNWTRDSLDNFVLRMKNSTTYYSFRIHWLTKGYYLDWFNELTNSVLKFQENKEYFEST